MTEDEYLTLKEAQELFKISHTILYRLKKDKKLTFYYSLAPRKVRIKRSELEALRTPTPKS